MIKIQRVWWCLFYSLGVFVSACACVFFCCFLSYLHGVAVFYPILCSSSHFFRNRIICILIIFCFTFICMPTCSVRSLYVFYENWFMHSDCSFRRKIQHKKISSSSGRSMMFNSRFNSTSVWCANTLVNCENFVRFELETFSTLRRSIEEYEICSSAQFTTIVLRTFWNDVLLGTPFRPVYISSSFFNKLFVPWKNFLHRAHLVRKEINRRQNVKNLLNFQRFFGRNRSLKPFFFSQREPNDFALPIYQVGLFLLKQKRSPVLIQNEIIIFMNSDDKISIKPE